MKYRIPILIFMITALLHTTACPVSASDTLTKRGGVHDNHYGYTETYYNLPMDRVVQMMRDKGYSETDYPYWVRDDGVKMLGGLVMVAADLDIHPKGDVVNTSLGMGIVVDTGSAIIGNRIDIATAW